MPREDYLNIDISKVIADIGNNWTSENDFQIKKETGSYNSSIAALGQKRSLGRKLSKETIFLISEGNKKKKLSKKHIEAIVNSRLGVKHSEDSINKMIINSPNAKSIIYKGIKYNSIAEASRKLNMCYGTLKKHIKLIENNIPILTQKEATIISNKNRNNK